MDIPGTIPPNGPDCYTTSEIRTGPPLDYVAEKLRTSLSGLHSVHAQVRDDVPDGLPCPEAFRTKYPQWDPKRELLSSCGRAFQYGVISYLALNNLLALSNDPGLFDRLLAMPFADFCRWLDSIDREGSVT